MDEDGGASAAADALERLQCRLPSVSSSSSGGGDDSGELAQLRRTMRQLPREVRCVRSELISTDAVTCCDGRHPMDGSFIVELRLALLRRLTDAPTPEEVAKSLAYHFYVLSRLLNPTASEWTNGGGGESAGGDGVTLVVDARRGRGAADDAALVELCRRALRLLVAWLPGVLKRMLWLDDPRQADSPDVLSLFDDSDAVNLDFLSMDELHERVGRAQLSTKLGGERLTNGAVWVDFRQNLDAFFRTCRSLGELYVNFYKDLRAVNDSDSFLRSLTADQLRINSRALWQRLDDIEQSRLFAEISADGDCMLENLQANYPELKTEQLTSYVKAVEKASRLYREVRRVMERTRSSINRRCSLLDQHASAASFTSQANELLRWAEDEAIAAAARLNGEPSASLTRLRLQERQFEQCVATARPRLAAAEQLLLDAESVCNGDGGALLAADHRQELGALWSALLERSEAARSALDGARERLADRLVCHHMLEKVYDWALQNAKWSAQLSVLIGTAEQSAVFAAANARDLLAKVGRQLDKFPGEELEQLPVYAKRLGDDRLIAQSDQLAARCGGAEKMLRKQRAQLEELSPAVAQQQNTQREEGSSSPVSTEYEQPLSRVVAYSEDYVDADVVVNWRRRSTTESTTKESVDFPFGFKPLQRICSESNLDDLANEGAVSDSQVITSDLTHRVIESMSEQTLRRRLAARRPDGAPLESMPLPDAAALGRGELRGSARYAVKSKKPFRAFIPRQSSADEPLDPSPSARSNRFSVISLDNESVDSDSLSSPSTRSSAARAADEERSMSPPPLDAPPAFDAPPPPDAELLRSVSPPPGATTDQRMQCMIVSELLQTEINYVQSLRHVIEHYLPELMRDDLPLPLRGQRYTIFANVEKIYEFHVQEFLPRLQRQARRTGDSLCLEIGKCFLDCRPRFHLYALYNKNKPRSDELLAECASTFFRTTQLRLGHSMDLSSYLLKPVQRVGKYALLLQQLLKSCPAHDQEAADALRRAEEMVSFQLRHGNDLLAMDLIRGCDVRPPPSSPVQGARVQLNLKEQGTLLRQNEFTITEKSSLGVSRRVVRRVFLFEHILLFAKPKRRRGALPATPSAAASLADCFKYKHSIKMSDLGLTEEVRDSPLKFEVWFRRHTASSTFVFQAATASLRHTWINDISRLLWKQALRNRDERQSEMTHMGLGERSSRVDLDPSTDRIEDRTVNSSLLHKMARFRNSFAAFTRPTAGAAAAAAQKRPHSLISIGSSSGNSSNSSCLTSGCGRSASLTPGSVESGICSDLGPLHESPDDSLTLAPAGAIRSSSKPPAQLLTDENTVTV